MQRRGGGGGGGGNAGIVVSSDSGDGGGGNRRRPPPPTRGRRTLFPLLLFVSLSLLCVGAMLAHHLRRRSLSSAPSSSGARRKNLFDDASSAGDLRAMHVRKSKVGHVVDGRRGKKGSSFYGNERRYDDDDVGITSKKTNATLHLIFSTDCELYCIGAISHIAFTIPAIHDIRFSLFRPSDIIHRLFYRFPRL